MKEPTCHFDIPCGFGDAVLNHTGVCVVDGDIVEYRDNLHGHILRIQLKAGVGDFWEVGSSVNLGCPDHCGLGEPPGSLTSKALWAGIIVHIHLWDAEGCRVEGQKGLMSRSEREDNIAFEVLGLKYPGISIIEVAQNFTSPVAPCMAHCTVDANNNLFMILYCTSYNLGQYHKLHRPKF